MGTLPGAGPSWCLGPGACRARTRPRLVPASKGCIPLADVGQIPESPRQFAFVGGIPAAEPNLVSMPGLLPGPGRGRRSEGPKTTAKAPFRRHRDLEGIPGETGGDRVRIRERSDGPHVGKPIGPGTRPRIHALQPGQHRRYTPSVEDEGDDGG